MLSVLGAANLGTSKAYDSASCALLRRSAQKRRLLIRWSAVRIRPGSHLIKHLHAPSPRTLVPARDPHVLMAQSIARHERILIVAGVLGPEVAISALISAVSAITS